MRYPFGGGACISFLNRDRARLPRVYPEPPGALFDGLPDFGLAPAVGWEGWSPTLQRLARSPVAIAAAGRMRLPNQTIPLTHRGQHRQAVGAAAEGLFCRCVLRRAAE